MRKYKTIKFKYQISDKYEEKSFNIMHHSSTPQNIAWDEEARAWRGEVEWFRGES
jgi:hypothetical protein